MAIKYNQILLIILCLIASLAFLQVTFFSMEVIYALFVICFAAFLIKGKIKVDSLTILGLFLIPFWISLLSLMLFYILPDQRFLGADINWLGRLSNLVFLSVFYLLSASVIGDSLSKNERTNADLFIKFYMLGCGVLLVSAVWHALSIYTGFVSFNLETRSQVHSAGSALENLQGRVTGFAREPSYLVPFLVDFIALTFFVYGFRLKTYALSFLAIFIILLSLSPSGYISVFGAFFLSFFCVCLRHKIGRKFVVAIFLALLFGVILYIYLSNSGFLDYIFYRIDNYSPGSSGRAFMNFYPLVWLLDSNFLNSIFGFGMKSFSIIGYHYLLPDGSPVHITSNNLFVDVAWESGLLGFIFLIIFFGFLFVKIISPKMSISTRFFTFFLFFDLSISSFFRADFSSIRFFFIIVVFYLILYKSYSLKSE